jgi:hypothetical protein
VGLRGRYAASVLAPAPGDEEHIRVAAEAVDHTFGHLVDALDAKFCRLGAIG